MLACGRARLARRTVLLVQLIPGSAADRTQLGVFKRGDLLRGHGLTRMSVLGLAGDIIKNPGRSDQVHKVPKSLTVTITGVLGQLPKGHAGGKRVSETVGGCTDSDPIQSEGSNHKTMWFLFCVQKGHLIPSMS